MNTYRNKTLQELENSDWVEPTYDSYLVSTVHRLRRKPIEEFTIEDLRVMIGQNIGLQYLLALAIERLEENPLAEGDYYTGDLCATEQFSTTIDALHKTGVDRFIKQMADSILDGSNRLNGRGMPRTSLFDCGSRCRQVELGLA